mgnify:CR=1 FL=1
MHLLVADDDQGILGLLTEYFNRQGLSVHPASDGEQALEIAGREPVRIAIIDWFMPGINGIELTRKIREKEGPCIYIIMMTGQKVDDLLSVFDAGVDEFILKPISLADIYARIRVAMRVITLEDTVCDLRRRLDDADNIRSRFIGLAAHELRNPMISIRGFSELLLKEKGGLNEEQGEFVSIVRNTSDSMLALLNDLLDLSQIESGKLTLKKCTGCLRKRIEARIRLHRLQADQKRITIHTEFRKVPDMDFDEQRINQAVDNLLTNAIKFSPPGTNIYIGLNKENGYARFSVRDEGPGIPSEEHALLFNEFQRLSIKPTAGESCTGLGLAITKKIIEAHGGIIEFESRVGQGTTFIVKLPLASEA